MQAVLNYIPQLRFVTLVWLGIYLATALPTWLMVLLPAVLTFSTIIGAICLLFCYKETLTPLDIKIKFIKFSAKSSYLFKAQLNVLACSLLFFYFIGLQLEFNPRIENFPAGEIIARIQQSPWQLAFIPWLNISIVAIMISYFAVYRDRLTFFNWYLVKWLHHNIVWPILHASWVIPLTLLVTMLNALLADASNILLTKQSLFATPISAVVSALLSLLLYRKNAKRLLTFAMVKKLSLGFMITFYVISFALLLTLFNCALNLILPPDFTALVTYDKSELLATLIGDSAARLDILIWGWWLLLGPWLALHIAHHALNQNIWLTLVQANVLPAFLFLIILPAISSETITNVIVFSHQPLLQIMLSAAILFILQKRLNNIRNFADLSNISLIPFGRFRKNSISNVVRILINTSSLYIVGVFFLGWLPEQIIVTIASIYISILLVSTILVFIMQFFLPKAKLI